jgi:glycosyltransferase involved in cell wall biosynthesis
MEPRLIGPKYELSLKIEIRFFLVKKAPVSVVIPCYCCADTIERAVNSVIAQTVAPEEILLVDDKSEDCTLKVLWKLQRRYPQAAIKVIPLKKNSGPSVSRNRGWDESKQPYIAFLDADDSWHPRKIEIQYRWMSKHPSVALTGHPCLWMKKGMNHPEVSSVWHEKTVSPTRLLLGNLFSTPSVMLRKELLFRFDPNRRFAEDYLLWLQIVLSGHTASELDLPLAYLHKAPYGEGGLSGNLWEMEKSELQNYKELRDKKMISFTTYCLLLPYSWVKFFRRSVHCFIQRNVENLKKISGK